MTQIRDKSGRRGAVPRRDPPWCRYPAMEAPGWGWGSGVRVSGRASGRAAWSRARAAATSMLAAARASQNAVLAV